MSDRTLKKSLSGKTNRPADFVVGDADENLDLFSVNRSDLTSLDVLLKPGKNSFEQAKPETDFEKKHGNEPVYTVPEVPLGKLSRLVLEARNVTSKLQSISTTKAGSKREIDPSSKPTRSTSNIPTFRPSNNGATLSTVRSSSVPKETTTASASASKRTVSRSLTPVSRKTPSPTPSRISTTTSKKAGDAQITRSVTPRSKPQTTATSSRTHVRSASVSSPRLKEPVTLAFGRPVGTTKRNTSPDVTRTRPKGHSMIPSVSHTSANPKSLKSTSTVSDSTRSGKKLSKASVQIANNHLDVSRNGKVSTMLYPHSIRSSSSSLRKRCGSEGGNSSCSNQEEEEEEGRSLRKEEKKDSARYEALLNVKDLKDTNWLLNLDDHHSNHSLFFDNSFDSPPEPFSPL